MRLYTIGSLIALLSCSSCSALDRNTSASQPAPLSRATAFAGQVAGTFTELVNDLAPLAKTVVEEVANELPGDLTKIREDVVGMTSATPKKNSSPPLSQATALTERLHGTVRELVGNLAPSATAIVEKVSRELSWTATKVREGLFEHAESRSMPQ